MATAAIYYYTDRSEKRPVYCQTELDNLTTYAQEQGYQDITIYCDRTLKESEHIELQRLLGEVGQYDALVVKDFRHLCKTTGKCLEIMKEVIDRGVKVYSMLRGQFTCTDPPTDKTLRVATYISKDMSSKVNDLIAVQNDIFMNFVRLKTSWTVTDQYSDIAASFLNIQDLVHMEELIEHRDKYDLLLVRCFNDLYWQTGYFARIRQRLGLPIYAMEEGYMI